MNFMDKINLIAEQAIKDKKFPGAVIGYIKDGQKHISTYGSLTYDSGASKTTPETIYDLASISKVIPTASVILKLIEQGKLTESTKIIDFIPELKNKYRDQITVKHLLTYTILFDLPRLSEVALKGGHELLKACLSAELAFAPGEKFFYSNFPSTLLAMIAEKATGKKFTTLANEMFFEPLKMTSSTFDPKLLPNVQIAPTEVEPQGIVVGEVHDESARALYKAGLTVSHAGLFSTADDLLTFAQMLLNNGSLNGREFFKPETVMQMHTNQLGDINQKMGLGWFIKGSGFDFIGNAPSNEAFGMTGFTGTSILIDPTKKRALVALTNATFPKRYDNRDDINSFRRSLADVVFA